MSENEFRGDPTESTEVSDLKLSHTHWELHIVQEGLREFRIPFYQDQMDLGKHAADAFSESIYWTATLTDNGAELSNRESGESLTLTVGESVLLNNRRIWLVDVRRPPVGSLEGVSPEVAGKVWHIKNQLAWVGRRGKRMNHLEFDHPTVSRTQATFSVDQAGRVSLMAEAAASPTTVNGEVLSPGKSADLALGDLVTFGKLRFRFSTRSESTDPTSALYIQTLGTFRVTLGSKTGPEVTIAAEKSRWLLAYVATRWTSALAVEPLLESFWPGVDRTRCRKNLSYTLKQLKESFQEAGADLDDFLSRSPSEYRLEPNRLGEHDYIELRALISPRKALTSEVALQRVIRLHQGPFLSTCYEEWAENIRQSLENDLVQTLLATCEHLLERGEHSAVKTAAKHLLTLDPLSEQASLFRMRAALEEAKPQEAVDAYQQLEAKLKDEGLEPSMELLRCYHRARMGL